MIGGVYTNSMLALGSEQAAVQVMSAQLQGKAILMNPGFKKQHTQNHFKVTLSLRVCKQRQYNIKTSQKKLKVKNVVKSGKM
jgi:hypothetical protein